MIKVGITGQSGFMGTHLYNTLGLYPDKFERIPFKDEYFQNEETLNNFVSQCDAIVHMAAMNRHNDPQTIYDTNIGLVKQLVNALEKTQSTPHVLFSSSIHEKADNLYGRSKKEGRLLLEKWADKNNARFSGLIIPNTFGPFGHPYYNSVIATFCHQLTHNEKPRIEIDNEIGLIYVADVVNEFIDHIIAMNNEKSKLAIVEEVPMMNTVSVRVSDLLKKITEFKENYYEKGIIPDLDNNFDKNLFNTFICYIDHPTFFPFQYKLNTDDRGSFVETMKLNSGGQVSFSTTKPGITRGNHYHTRKAERFAVIKGKAQIQLRRIGTDKVMTFELDGNQPSFVDMPIWHTHNITNTGTEDLYTIFWINEHYDANDPDTFFENV
jgi:UDP-2-acetamido-2,6-beta-L-arabino-hexul-4-ose reductase